MFQVLVILVVVEEEEEVPMRDRERSTESEVPMHTYTYIPRHPRVIEVENIPKIRAVDHRSYDFPK
jgi:hypothetical protein